MAEEIEFYRETEFKDTEIGRIPREWEVMVAADVADYINGYPFSPADWKMHGVPIIRIQNLNDPNAEFNCFDGKVDDIYKIKNGDLLFSWSASIGIHIWKGGDAVLNQHIFKVVPKANINKLFLYYGLLLAIEQLKSRVHGSTMKHFQKNELKTIFMPIPPLPEQQKIAEILSTIDEAIQKTDDIIAKTERLKKGLMQELLTKGIGHKEFKDTEIGRIPKNWEVKKLKEIAEQMYYGLSVSGVEAPTQYKLITTTSINKETFKLDEGKVPFCNLITNEDKQTKKLTKYFVKKEDILVSRSGTTGVVILVDKDYKNMLFGSYLIKIKLNSLIDPKFFWYFSQSLFYWQQVSPRGATIKNINLQILKNLQVPLPSLEEQRKISEILLTADEKLENLRRERIKLDRIKQWFMEELLSGRIRVRVT